jgi:hypothetical protein
VTTPPAANRLHRKRLNAKRRASRIASTTPESSFPKQAVVVIHGIGEQRPMDTITKFVRAVWETDPEVSQNGKPSPAETWSRPDVRTGSLELRRITTRQSTKTEAFPRGVRSDFYELYWADLSAGSTWDQVQAWVMGLLFRNPRTAVPPNLWLAWAGLWVISLIIVVLLAASMLPATASIFGLSIWRVWPLSWLAELPAWALTATAAVLASLAHRIAVPYAGRVVRYTRATPDNIGARKNIRERGLALLNELHGKDYERIIVVGHSLGSILAYDLINYFWARRNAARTFIEGTEDFEALKRLEEAVARLDKQASAEAVAAFREAQRTLSERLGKRAKPNGDQPDSRWLITDLVTLGSPLTHAEFLLAKDAAELQRRIAQREFPTCPPVRELLDRTSIAAAQTAGLPFDEHRPQLMGFPFGHSRQWQLHFACPYAVVSWTNIHDPARFVFCGDIISGPLLSPFGAGVRDVDLRQLRGQSWRFSHTRYWTLSRSGLAGAQVKALREALDLSGLRLGA